MISLLYARIFFFSMIPWIVKQSLFIAIQGGRSLTKGNI